MTDWTETELSALRRAYASGTTRVSYDGKSVDYGSAEDLLARIRTIERAIAGVGPPAAGGRARRLLARGSLMSATWFDHAIATVAPRMAARRVMARQAFETLTRGYDGAARMATEGWRAPGSSADTEIGVAGALLRDRMRDLVRNNPHAAKAVAVLVNNIIGAGIMPAPPAATTSSTARSMGSSNAGQRTAMPMVSSTSTGCKR